MSSIIKNAASQNTNYTGDNMQLRVKLNMFQKSDNLDRDSSIFASQNQISASQSKSLLQDNFADYYDKQAQKASSGQKSSIGISGLDVSA